ncbi:CUB domain-containing protein 2, partial [Clonorchis sinensis]
MREPFAARKHRNYRPTCGHVLTGEFGEIKSPNYPFAYPDNLICSWTIRKPQKRSELIFLSFEVEESYVGRKCQFDFVLIQVGTHNRPKIYGPLCGYDIPGPFQFEEEVLITFQTDRIGAYSGFHAFYRPLGWDMKPSTPVPKPPTEPYGEMISGESISSWDIEVELGNNTSCDYNITHESGILTSPNYPQNYGNNLGCSWVIKKPKKPSLLRFLDFEVEEVNWGDECQFDYVYVFVGTGIHVTSYGPFCGNVPPEPIQYSDEVQITFTTDKNETRRGFALEFGPG